MSDIDTEMYNDWLEFKTLACKEANDEYFKSEFFINIKRTEISEVRDDIDKCRYSDCCSIVMKNGNRYVVKMSYEKVMDIV